MSDSTNYGSVAVQGLTLEKLLRVISDGEWVPTAANISGTLTVDTINEYTGAAGVTIDSVLLKDSIIRFADTKGFHLVNNDSYLRFAGGWGLSDGSNIIMYGGAHATRASDFRVLVGAGDVLVYDHSGTLWTFADGATMEVDTINEATGAAGVTIDNVECKDGGVTIAATKRLTFTASGDAEAIIICEETSVSVGDDPTTDAPDAWVHFYVSGQNMYIPCYANSP
jgi:hypothetical protein